MVNGLERTQHFSVLPERSKNFMQLASFTQALFAMLFLPNIHTSSHYDGCFAS